MKTPESRTCRRILVIAAAHGGEAGLAAVVAPLARRDDATVQVVGVVERRMPLPADALDAGAAAALAKAIAHQTGGRPDWDVLYGRTASRAVLDHVRCQRPDLVVVAQAAGPRRSGRLARRLARAGVPVRVVEVQTDGGR